jgi:hypothetical protein
VADGAMSEHLSARRPAEPGGEQTPQPLRVEVVTTRRRHDEQAPAESVRASEPVVHVTIGRIEIRAVEERASRPTPSQRPPALSLDDYLAERNQGRPR